MSEIEFGYSLGFLSSHCNVKTFPLEF